jgi:hypothetical protein
VRLFIGNGHCNGLIRLLLNYSIIDCYDLFLIPLNAFVNI